MKLKEFKGTFPNMDAVVAAFPSGVEGDFILVDGEVKGWNQFDNQWEKPTVEPAPSSRNTETIYGDLNVHHNVSIGGTLSAPLIRGKNSFCGVFDTDDSLRRHRPNPVPGEWAMVFAYTTPPSETPTERGADEITIGFIFIEDDGDWAYSGYKGGYDGTFDAIQQEKEDRISDVADLAAAIVAERTRAEDVEAALLGDVEDGNPTSIAAETAAREQADAALLGNVVEGEPVSIAEETERAKGIEGGLRTDVDTINGKIPTGTNNTNNKLTNVSDVNTAVSGAVSAEASLRQDGDAILSDVIYAESTRAQGIEGNLGDAIELINGKIPSTATSSNKLTDKKYVDDADETLQANIDTEASTRASADNTLSAAVQTEKTRAKAKENELQASIIAEETRAQGIESGLRSDVNEIKGKIPVQASSQNQLADKAFVTTNISVATADFKGTYTSVAELIEIPANKNDYAYVETTDEEGNLVLVRYKYVEGTGWVYEFQMNNSTFTAEEWASIKSGVTDEDVLKLRALPTNAQLVTTLAGKAAKSLNAVPGHVAVFDSTGNPVDSGTDLSVVYTDGAFDVSAYNNNAKFASLEALLNDERLSTLIPTDVRKGGMTLKFIQSFDNKYVQYRLMSQNWSTIVSDWQGVDDAPILRSNNLISSGAVQASETGILNKIQELKLEVDGNAAYMVDEELFTEVGYGKGVFDVKPNTKYRLHIKSDSPVGQTGEYGCIVMLKQGETTIYNFVFGNQDLSIERTDDVLLSTAYQDCKLYFAVNVAVSTNVHIWLEEIETAYDSVADRVDILGFSKNVDIDVDASESAEALYGTTAIYKNDFKAGMLARIEVLSVGNNGVSYVQVLDEDNSRRIFLLQNQTLKTGQVLYANLPLDTKHISVVYGATEGYHLQANINLQINTQAEFTNLNECVTLLDFSEDVSIDVDAASSQQAIYGTAKAFNGQFKAGMLARMEVKSIGSDNYVSYVDLYDIDNDDRIILLQNQTLQAGIIVYANLPHDTHNIRISYAATEGHHLVADVNLQVDLQAKVTKLSEEEKVTTTEYVVNPNGGGDFTSLVACFNAITDSSYYKRYRILLAEGTYDMEQEFWGSNPHTEDIGPMVPPYVSIEGQGFKENTIIKAELSDSEAVNIARVFSPLNMNNSCTLKNLTVIAKNCRYAVHAEAMAAGTEFSVINCKFHHKGTIQETGTAFAAFGLGYPSKSKFNFTGCEFQSDAVGAYPSFICHDTLYGEASVLEFEACKFTSQDTANWDMYQRANGGKGGDSVIFKGCEFAHSSNSVLCGLESGSTDRTANFYAYACKNFSFDNRTGDSYTPFMVACV